MLNDEKLHNEDQFTNLNYSAFIQSFIDELTPFDQNLLMMTDLNQKENFFYDPRYRLKILTGVAARFRGEFVPMGNVVS